MQIDEVSIQTGQNNVVIFVALDGVRSHGAQVNVGRIKCIQVIQIAILDNKVSYTVVAHDNISIFTGDSGFGQTIATKNGVSCHAPEDEIITLVAEYGVGFTIGHSNGLNSDHLTGGVNATRSGILIDDPVIAQDDIVTIVTENQVASSSC